LKEGRSNARGALKEYLEVFSNNLEGFRIDFKASKKPYYILFFENIDSLLPYRNEWQSVLDNTCSYLLDRDWITLYYSFFEAIHAHIKTPIGESSYFNREEENMKFFEGELFLLFLATLLRYDRLEEAADVLTHQFFDQTVSTEFGASIDFTGFYHSINSFHDKSQAEHNNLISYRSKTMIDRAKTLPPLNEVDIMQADLIAFLRYALHDWDALHHWTPHSLLYASNRRSPFPVFARAVSKSYYGRLAKLLGVSSKEELLEKYNEIRVNNHLPTWTMNYPAYHILMNLDYIDTK
jgi:hypothetical protein